MIVKKRFFKLPPFLIAEQQANPLTKDLYLCELSEILIKRDTLWSENIKLDNHLLIYCVKGGGIIQISNDLVPFGQDQYCVIPQGFIYKIQTGGTDPSVFLLCKFNGDKTRIMEKDFAVVRDLIPSVTNMVANRVMLFDELFNNLTKGFYNANYIYLNLCFGHLLATFIYASRTSDDILEEQNPPISRSIQFMEQNLNRKITLHDIADEAGYSSSYFTTLFRRKTGYSPLSYFVHLRISKACEYLDYSKLKIKEISFMLGYSDPYYFSKDFQKKMGLSPRHYRNRILEKNSSRVISSDSNNH
ncbi:MAG TPA: AraC family transcriptional regulator [Bacteroidales bacterium]|nr:AraC family transcriptional regulator [Bacteroidales bacterium]